MVSQDAWDDLWGSSEEKAPTKSSSYNSVNLARYFQEQLLRSSWYRGFGVVNIQVLASQFAKWKNVVTADRLTAMIDFYMNTADQRGNAPGWQDFVYRRDQLLSALLKSEEQEQELDNYELRMEEYDEEAELAAYFERRKS